MTDPERPSSMEIDRTFVLSQMIAAFKREATARYGSETFRSHGKIADDYDVNVYITCGCFRPVSAHDAPSPLLITGRGSRRNVIAAVSTPHGGVVEEWRNFFTIQCPACKCIHYLMGPLRTDYGQTQQVR